MSYKKELVLVILVLIAIACIFMLPAAKASELSDFTYIVNHQDNIRNKAVLNDMAYKYGGFEHLVVRMNWIAYQPVLSVNALGQYNTTTQNVEYTGTWARK
jgi:hypothetical protein